MTEQQVKELIRRSLRAIKVEKNLRDILVTLQESQQIDLQQLNQLQLRLQARSIAINVLEEALQKE